MQARTGWAVWLSMTETRAKQLMNGRVKRFAILPPEEQKQGLATGIEGQSDRKREINCTGFASLTISPAAFVQKPSGTDTSTYGSSIFPTQSFNMPEKPPAPEFIAQVLIPENPHEMAAYAADVKHLLAQLLEFPGAKDRVVPNSWGNSNTLEFKRLAVAARQI